MKMETAVGVIGAFLLSIIVLLAIGDKLNSSFKRKHHTR